MLKSNQKKALLKRIRYVSGQMAAIERMVETDRDPTDIYTQLQSVRSAFENSIIASFEDEHRRALAALIVERQEMCPGVTCDVCDVVRAVQQQFPTLTIAQVLEHLVRLQQ